MVSRFFHCHTFDIGWRRHQGPSCHHT